MSFFRVGQHCYIKDSQQVQDHPPCLLLYGALLVSHYQDQQQCPFINFWSLKIKLLQTTIYSWFLEAEEKPVRILKITAAVLHLHAKFWSLIINLCTNPDVHLPLWAVAWLFHGVHADVAWAKTTGDSLCFGSIGAAATHFSKQMLLNVIIMQVHCLFGQTCSQTADVSWMRYETRRVHTNKTFKYIRLKQVIKIILYVN